MFGRRKAKRHKAFGRRARELKGGLGGSSTAILLDAPHIPSTMINSSMISSRGKASPVLRNLLFAAILTISAIVSGQETPGWQPSDFPERAPKIYGVEIARFPSAVLADGVRRSLENFGWSPVLLYDQEGSQVVVLGETADIGAAYQLLEEVRFADIAEGRVIEIPSGQASAIPRGFSGPVLEPFLPTPGSEKRDVPPMSEMIERLRSSVANLQTENGDQMRAMLALWEDENYVDPAFSEGALLAARFLYRLGSHPETALMLAGKLARGDWPSTTAERLAAQELTTEILYRYRRDWRAAWSSTDTLLDSPTRSDQERAGDMLRQAALLVELYDREVSPAPTLPEIRARLEDAFQLTGEDKTTQAKIALLYLRTFAWAGDWARVQELAELYLSRYAEQRPWSDYAKIHLAQSMERLQQYRRGIKLLDEIITDPPAPDQLLRFEFRTHSPVSVAMEVKAKFQEQVGIDTAED